MNNENGAQINSSNDGLEWWEIPESTLIWWEEQKKVFALEAAERKRIETLRRDARKLMPEIARRDGKVCRVCGATEGITVDHIFPLSRGGTNDLDNLQLLCGPCNSSKGAKV